ncbi:cell division protein ZapE [Terrihabitans soli]|uniref:Cell division protein ZapE n=1 Tax=Terrihabitans soli TaxID=708113 RepID=A0A6S6QQ72_9HYPH|nr:cell division protein ZapE [Terrihabitans soli]
MRAETAQVETATRFDRLIAELGRKPGLFRKAHRPRGIYLWGEAGRGKTFLMDLFFRHAPEPRKKRVHFHAFMTQMHERLKDFKEERGRQPIQALAESVAAEARLLCLDELQIKDIADATIVARLFTELIAQGTVIVTTSNAPPERLYWKGINRDLFLPFIALIQRELDVIRLDVPQDFRLQKLLAAPVWFVPPDETAKAALDRAFADLAGAPKGEPETLRVQGRDLVIPNTLNGVARFTFAELCDRPLGPADFGAIARTFHTLIVDGVPKLDSQSNDIVRRFVILIDELYELRVKLIASAEAPPGELMTRGDQSWDFQRTRSRLAEMGSKDWLALPHGQEVDLNSD